MTTTWLGGRWAAAPAPPPPRTPLPPLPPTTTAWSCRLPAKLQGREGLLWPNDPHGPGGSQDPSQPLHQGMPVCGGDHQLTLGTGAVAFCRNTGSLGYLKPSKGFLGEGMQWGMRVSALMEFTSGIN